MISSRPRKALGKANTITWQGQGLEDKSDLQEAYGILLLLKSHNLGLLVAIPPPDGAVTFSGLLQTAFDADS
jgi:hypothetical protein